MSIDLTTEKELVLSTSEIYDILDFATQAAYDDGFMNSFVFERALYVFAAIRLCEDRRDEIASIAANNIIDAWSSLLEDGTIEQLAQDYKSTMDILAEYGAQWFDDYTTYAHSARGLLNTIQMFTGDVVRNAAQQFQSVSDGSSIQNVLKIAEDWGMNNEAPINNIAIEDESVFAQ